MSIIRIRKLIYAPGQKADAAGNRPVVFNDKVLAQGWYHAPSHKNDMTPIVGPYKTKRGMIEALRADREDMFAPQMVEVA